MEELQKHLSKVKVPCETDNVYKDECLYTFDTPDTSDGVYVSMSTFLCFGSQYWTSYAKATDNYVFLHIKRTRKEIKKDPVNPGDPEPEKKITRLAIGVEGGFDLNEKQYEYTTTYAIAVAPGNVRIPYPNEELPLQVSLSAEAIIRAESALSKESKEALAGTWDGEKRVVSKHADGLLQLANGIKIPPSGWKCEKCDLTTNLWLNLTDGKILCGRKFFDGTGGNDHAVQHFQETKYPLAVKLGTITADGKGDVYSYDEDDMVEDPKLREHLQHFGINVGVLEKTEKSMVEMELELNQKIGEWGLLCESNSQLEPVYGPGYTGMKNLGNSCYLNSVIQVLFSVEDFQTTYVKDNSAMKTFPADPINDFKIQIGKVGVALLNGNHAIPAEGAQEGAVIAIPPLAFKTLVGRGHADFSTNTQQDAHEYFLHIMNLVCKNARPDELNPADAFKFRIEDRVECGTSGKVKYTYRDEWSLPLNIPLDTATNITEVREYEKKRDELEKAGQKVDPNEIVRPRIPLNACIEHFAAAERVEQFYSSAINGKTFANKTARLASMPDYLMLQLKKFTVRQDWTEVKLDVAIDIPDVLDLSELRGTGLKATEEQLPEIQERPPSPPPADPQQMEQLQDMGFPVEACKKALFFTKNAGLDAATNWIMMHMDDADFGDPFIPPGTETAKPRSAFVPDPTGIETITNMGFTELQATKALKESGNNTERAVDWILTHQDELWTIEEPMEQEPIPEAAGTYRDGSGKYKLVAFISHMGTSSMVGHYVCHMFKDGRWVIFNDEKVAISQNPPKELAYLYLYKRITDQDME